jgi:hypothetical protein
VVKVRVENRKAVNVGNRNHVDHLKNRIGRNQVDRIGVINRIDHLKNQAIEKIEMNENDNVNEMKWKDVTKNRQ